MASAPSYYSIITGDAKLLCIFEHLVAESLDEIVPVFEEQVGYYYADIAKACGTSPQESIELAEKVVSLGLGTREYHDQILKCPHCGSDRVTSRVSCPFCNSPRIIKEALIEHISDGVMAPLSSFKKEGESLICPGCKKALPPKTKEYRTVGAWYKCSGCEKQFDSPRSIYRCRNCGKEFAVQDLTISFVSRIKVNKEALAEFSRHQLILRPVLEAMRKAGYEASSPGVIVGKSGVKHVFNLMGRREDGTITVDIAVAKAKDVVNESSVFNTFAKVLDTTPAKSFLMCIPSISESAKKFASLYRIVVVEGASVEEATKSLGSHL